jgi:hypothetical protein
LQPVLPQSEVTHGGKWISQTANLPQEMSTEMAAEFNVKKGWIDDAFQAPRRASRSGLINFTSFWNAGIVPTTHELMALTAASDSKSVVC